MADDSGDPTVFVVDDHEAFRESVRWLIASVGLTVELHGSARSLLDNVTPGRTGCVVADVRMAGISGLELQVMLRERGIALPIIIMTAHGDVAMAVRAMKQGAFDFVQKPFNDQVFLDLVQKAVEESVATADIHCTEQRSRRALNS